jgi:hypothetical protein
MNTWKPRYVMYPGLVVQNVKSGRNVRVLCDPQNKQRLFPHSSLAVGFKMGEECLLCSMNCMLKHNLG